MAAADTQSSEAEGEKQCRGEFEAGLSLYPRTLGEGRPTDYGSCTPPK